MDGDPRYVLALDEARRGIAQQNTDLASLRSRAVSTLGFGGLAASFIGGLVAGQARSVSPAAWVAVGAFVVAVATTLMSLRPVTLRFVQSPKVIMEWANKHEADLAYMQQSLATELEDQYDHNACVLKRLMRWYTAGAAALGVELAALVAYLMGV